MAAVVCNRIYRIEAPKFVLNRSLAWGDDCYQIIVFAHSSLHPSSWSHW